MKRKDFFKKLGIGGITIFVAPRILTDIPDKDNLIIGDKEFMAYTEKWNPSMPVPQGWRIPTVEDYSVLYNEFFRRYGNTAMTDLLKLT